MNDLHINSEEPSATFDKIDGIIFSLPLEDKVKLWDLIEIYVKEETAKLKQE